MCTPLILLFPLFPLFSFFVTIASHVRISLSMKLLMISGDRSILQGKKGAFWYTLEAFRKHWDRIDIITPYAPKMKSKSDSVVGDVFFHPCPSGLWYQSTWIEKKGQELFEKHHHDVMTVHEYPPFYNGSGARKLSHKIGIPYALEVHHIVGHPKPASITEWFGRLLSRLYIPRNAKNASVIRTVNGEVKTILEGWGIPSEKIIVVPSFYLDGTVLRKQLQPPVIYDAVFCGRLVANKGLNNVIDAIGSLPGAKLLVIGDGPLRSRFEKKVEQMGLGDRVKFVGWLPTIEAVAGALQSARIFVMNSKSEGGPRVALEAMACGLPVLVTRVGVMADVIQDKVNGMFTDGTAGDLARKIRELLEDENLRNSLGMEAQQILNRFEREKLIGEYAEFLKKLKK